jgi:hypothetical protein
MREKKKQSRGTHLHALLGASFGGLEVALHAFLGHEPQNVESGEGAPRWKRPYYLYIAKASDLSIRVHVHMHMCALVVSHFHEHVQMCVAVKGAPM